MNTTIRQYIKHISLKNLLLPGIVLLIMIILMLSLPVDEMLVPREVSSADELTEAAEEGERFIYYEISGLAYTGYDFYDGSEAAASFYYVFTDDGESCVFFLIAKGKDTYSGRARIVTKDEYVNTFIMNYASDLGLSTGLLEEISGGFIVSGYDYNLWLYTLLALLLIAVAALCLVYILGNIIIFFFPHIHPACRRLKKYGLSGKDFSDIDRELAADCIVEAGNMFATSHYLVVFAKSTLYMIPLFNIVWAYKYLNRQIFVSKKFLSYTLVVYTSPGGRILMRGNRKKHTDMILRFLDRDFSHIAVGYTEERHRKFKEMFKKGEL